MGRPRKIDTVVVERVKTDNNESVKSLTQALLDHFIGEYGDRDSVEIVKKLKALLGKEE